MARRADDAADPDQHGEQMNEFEGGHGALVARLSAGSEGMMPPPWSITVQPSAASCSRKGFSTWVYSDMAYT